MTDLTPNDLSHLSNEEFNALCPQGYHAPGPAMTDLTPAAQAVLDAASTRWFDVDDDIPAQVAAAALCAAADQMVPEEPEPEQSAMPFSDWNLKIEGWDARIIIRRKLLAIAAELEGGAALAQPEPQGLEPTDEEFDERFQRWWYNEGSGMRPLNDEDQEEHARRVSRIAWHNGAYVERWGRPAVEPVPVSERPWEREGWCDAEGRCWMVNDLLEWDFRKLYKNLDSYYFYGYTHLLPHWALPVPHQEAGQ